MKKRKVVLLVVLAVLLIGMIVGVVAYVHNSKNVELKTGTLSDNEAKELMKEVNKQIEEDENHYSYYGGMYIKNQNLVLLLVKDEEIAPDVQTLIDQEEGIVVRYVKYSKVELTDKQKEINRKYETSYENDKEYLQLLEDFTGAYVDEENNQVVIKVNGVTNKKIRQFKKIFGNDKCIRYEEGGKGELLNCK